ncbi:MAG TPA: right-handed parallel beta-helix repeat-containing protein [Candidatus Binatia bacterium]|nr:right-handed parallel beta-helix repeat-containing protein [Candidatus Binatia bacterium]
MKRSDGILAFTLLIGVCCYGQADAATIAEGCAAPATPARRNTFYVDPAKGNMSNDGSAARPWSTLAEVLDSKRKLVATPSAPIKPGDLIYLNNGDHGNVQIAGAVNTDFITVQAAPGQTPTLRSLRVNGASKWMFVGLKVQGAGDGSTNSLPGSALIEFGRNLTAGPTSNIVFAGNSVSAADDSSRWADIDWVKKPFVTSLSTSATCVTISGNHFFNVRNAVSVDGDNTLVAENKIDNFGNDGINVVASNVTIRRNTIRDGRNSKSETLHPDGIQGWSKPGATNRNVVIDGNTIIKTGDTQVTAMQGISIFDGNWDGLTISNNVVVTNHWHGIALYGVKNARIVNNTIVPSDPVKFPTWITVQNAKNGTPSENVIVRNNITSQLTYNEAGVTADHNIVATKIGATALGKTTVVSKPGIHANRNVVDPNIYGTLVTVDNARGTYDLRPNPGSPAIGNGNPDSAPATDILGKPRTRPIDIGAYSHARSR